MSAQLTSIISVEGKDIPISYSNINSNSISLDSQDKKLYAEKGENTQIVFIAQNDLENQYLFTSGINLSKAMPTAGEITYKGKSFNIYSSDGTGTLNAITKGTSEFVADFNQKILTGTVKSSLENSAFKPVEISASITKNTFSGSKNYVSVQGGFFGENAGELIGDYRTEEGSQQNAIGAFRAEKSNN
ncbi:transferrin-binding protein-like solute binding protein [Mannheimia indoligenes]|uniref:transferrin-binding protein-like solute binding protein n=1 Tax=Mannheimia indoligenes TaxID=3103145 RepID=UPI002FE59DAF